MADRQNQLGAWVKSVMSMRPEETLQLAPVSGDASFRKYYRLVTGTKNLIVVDAPPQRENSLQFARVREMLDANGLTVPELMAADYENGFMLVSDFGNESYFQAAYDKSRAEGLYSDAIRSLLKIQCIDPCRWEIPCYDSEFIRRELTIFEEWFIDSFLGIDRFAGFADVADYLVECALHQPQVVMHRDYHSRNLMVTGSSGPGILDFQDAVLGPVAYDLASLLMDCYIEWPQPFIEARISEYLVGACQLGILTEANKARFPGWFDLIALQRHIKCVGIFSRLFQRDHKSHYLPDIPRVMTYMVRTSGRYQELKSFHQWLVDSVLPAMRLNPQLSGEPV